MNEPIRWYGLAILLSIAVPIFLVVIIVSLNLPDRTSLFVFAGSTYLSLAVLLVYGYSRYSQHMTVHEAQSRALQSLDRLKGIGMRKSSHYRSLSARYKESASKAIAEFDRLKENQDRELAHLSHELTEYINALTNSVDMQEGCALESINSIYNLLAKPHSTKEHDTLVAANGGLRQIIAIHDRIVAPSIESMMNILAQVIDKAGAKSSNHEIVLTAHPFRLSEEIEASIKPYFRKAKSKNIILNVDGTLEQSDDVYAVGDVFRIRQVVESLLDNAIRFTSRGKVAVTVSILTRASSDYCKLLVTVQDSGCGMSGAQAEHVTGIVTSGVKNKTDIGTSLNIAYRVTEKMGGELALLSSSLGVGSTFQFRVSLPKAKKPHPQLALTGPQTTSLSLLYVDDSMVSRATFKRICSSSPIEVHEAKDGRDGWDKYMNNDFDVLVIDLYMPIWDGFELVKKIRAHEKENGIEPKLIFALTASPTEKNREHALKSGFNEFLAKPYKKDVVSSIMNRLTGAQSSAA